MKQTGRSLLLAALLVLTGCSQPEPLEPAFSPTGYPPSRAGVTVDDYHGTRVVDPYRWLESLAAPDTQAWMRAQNAYTAGYLSVLPQREYFAERLRTLLDFERYGIPQSRNDVSVYTYNSGQLEQDQLRVSSGEDDPGRVLLDPNALSADGTVSLGQFELSPNGRYLAYSLSDGGSDWRTWAVLDTRNGREIDGPLTGIKFSDVSWTADSAGFFYSRYPRRATDDGYDDTVQVTIWYHGLGTDQSEDRYVFGVDDHPTRNPYARATEDGRYVVIVLFDGYEANGVYLLPLDGNEPAGPVIRLLDAWDARYDFLGNDGRRFFFQTTQSAPRGRIIAIDLDRPEPRHWQTLVEQRSEAIAAASLVANRLFVNYLVDASARVEMFSTDGESLGPVELPGRGSVAGFAGRGEAKSTFYSYTDFTTPMRIYRLTLADRRSTLVHSPRLSFRPEDYQNEQVFVTSRDGTSIPLTIVRRRDLDGSRPLPTVLYGYGGFNVSLLPRFSVSRMAWIQAGGVYAVANIRGGGEYGERWHRAGTLLNKQNVFDDFIAAAEWLIDERITSHERLAIWGGSNGGLLVGAVMTQRPALAAVAVPAVGVLDMLRYDTQSANARQWSSDYGLSEVPEQFAALYAYSPVHNLQPQTCYPATLIMADANDDRVAPWHSYKFAAALQSAQGCSRPALIRIETRTGHGGGASTSKIVAEYADQWAFVADRLGLTIPGQ